MPVARRSALLLSLLPILLTMATTIPAFVAAPVAHAQTPPAQAAMPAPAKTLLGDAQKRAAASKKAVLVVFHASWCGWCKRLDAKVLNDPEIGKLLGQHYEIVHLDVMESGDKKALENPGAAAVLTELGGEKKGLPFYAVLDPAGKKLGDSNRMPGGNNIGYPAAPDEIAAFTELLEKTAPRLSAADRGRVTTHLKANAPK